MNTVLADSFSVYLRGLTPSAIKWSVIDDNEAGRGNRRRLDITRDIHLFIRPDDTRTAETCLALRKLAAAAVELAEDLEACCNEQHDIEAWPDPLAAAQRAFERAEPPKD